MKNDIAMLLLRLSFGTTLCVAHGWSKLMTYAEHAATFPDPLGVGAPVSLALVIFAEFFCALAVVAGLFTRLSAVPVIITMLVAFFVIHGHDTWATKEASFVYAAAFLCIAVAGAGNFSLDYVLSQMKQKSFTIKSPTTAST